MTARSRTGRGIPCLVAVHQDATGPAKRIGLACARGLAGPQAGVLQTTFEEGVGERLRDTMSWVREAKRESSGPGR